MLLVTALTIEEIFSRGDFKMPDVEEKTDVADRKSEKLREKDEMYLSDNEEKKMKAKDILKQRMNELAEERELKRKLLEKRK